MNKLDIAFLILIGVSILYSFIRGLVREIFSFLAIILGFLGASRGYTPVAIWLSRWVENQTLAQILSFTVLFLLIALITSLLGKALFRLIKKMDLRWADRLGGVAFGFLKAILLIAMILLVLTAFLPPKSKVLSESRVSPNALAVAKGLSFLVPERLRALYAEKEKELKKYWAAQELAALKTETQGEKKR